jgi:alkylresorcinol/alkylpyrone synthase
LRVRLGRRIPDIAAELVEHVLDIIFAKNHLGVSDINYWLVHAAGAQVLDAVRDRMSIPEAKFCFSREILRRCGNCSSATIGLIGKEFIDTANPGPGERGLVISLGPGMTAGAALLKWPD